MLQETMLTDLAEQDAMKELIHQVQVCCKPMMWVIGDAATCVLCPFGCSKRWLMVRLDPRELSEGTLVLK